MKNLKFIMGFAASGFFLSLFCGLFSHAKILRLFLQALAFSIVFAILAVLIQIVYDRFLNMNDGIGGIDESGNSDSESQTGSAAVSSARSKEKPGSYVDVVIQDEELPTGDSDNKFYVGENRQMLNESDVSSTKKEESSGNDVKSEPEKKQFMPMQFKTVQQSNSENVVSENVKAAETAKPSAVPSKAESPASLAVGNTGSEQKSLSGGLSGASTNNSDVDVLPDMSDISFSSADKGNVNEEDDLSDSSFSESPVSSGASKKGGEIEIKDASLMAKAISSILSGEA